MDTLSTSAKILPSFFTEEIGEGISQQMTNVVNETAQAKGGGKMNEKQSMPRKRAFALVAFLSCLSFILMFFNSVSGFIKELLESDKLVRLANIIVKKVNCTEVSNCKQQ